MRLLLDSHVFLWWLMDDPALTKVAHQQIADPGNIVFVSAASLWELEIKRKIGKLKIPDSFLDSVRENHLEELPIRSDHIAQLARLPMHHRDPFDRVLVAQAQREGLTLLTQDRELLRYGETVRMI